jgi:hypothetical protein
MEVRYFPSHGETRVEHGEIAFKPISLDMLVDSPVIAGEFYRAIDITPPGETDPSRTRPGGRQRGVRLAISPETQKADDQPCG